MKVESKASSYILLDHLAKTCNQDSWQILNRLRCLLANLHGKSSMREGQGDYSEESLSPNHPRSILRMNCRMTKTPMNRGSRTFLKLKVVVLLVSMAGRETREMYNVDASKHLRRIPLWAM